MLTVSVAVFNPDPVILENFLKSLKKFTPELTQLLIFDNGSESKEFVDIVNKYFGQGLTDHKVTAKITHNNKNIGFGKAHNRNLAHANAKYFAVLNDDIEFFENWASPMIKLIDENPKVAQAGPKTNVFNTIAGDKIGQWIDTDEPEYCEGSCFIMLTALAKKYGLFDEIYQYGYFEDMDLSLRLRKDGYILRNADIKWQHHRGSTTVKMIANNFDLPGYYILNEYLFKKRWNAYSMKQRFGKTIVIKRAAGLEDVFLITPIIEALKDKYADCIVLLMTQTPDAVEGCHDIDGYVKYNNPIPCDIFIDLDFAYEKDFRKHIVDAYSEASNVKPKKKSGTLYIEKKDMEYAGNLLKEYPFSVTLDFSDSPSGKRWKRENYVELGKRIKQAGFSIITVGKNAEQTPSYLDADLSLINVLSYQQTALVIAKSKLFIGTDGLPAHFAQATRTPSIVLYGCTLPEYVADTSLPTLFPMVSPVACHGCRHRHAAGTVVICPREFACMEVIKVDDVYAAFKEITAKLNINPK